MLSAYFRKYKRDIFCLVLLTVAMVFIVLYELDFINRDFSIYDVLERDQFGICATIQAIREEGLRAAFFIDRWGAPEISSELCNPSIDLLTTIVIWIIGWFTSSSAHTFYIYFIITFVLCALCMHLFLRITKINVWISCVISAMYSLAPFHFLRIPHTAFIGYYTIPLCMIILYHIISLDSEKAQIPTWLLLICALIVGLGNPYYFFFGLILFALSYIIIFTKEVSKTHSIKEGLHVVFNKCWIFAIMCLVFFACQFPRILYMRALDTEYNAVGRYPYEAEVYGLKLIQMILPSPYHNNKLIQNLFHAYNSSGVSVNENMTACLGILGVIGLIILLWQLYKNFVLREKGFELIDFLALSNLLLLLVGTVGGLGTIFNYLITAQFRSYNRVSIFIACLCLTGLAIILEQIVSNNKISGTIVVIGVLILGLYDQVPLTPIFKYNVENSTRQKQLEKFFGEIEASLDKGEMVYQLPHMQFPENGYINNLPDASHFQGFVFTDSLRWSYGGIKGINTAAEKLYTNNGMSESFLEGLVDAGFSGIYINTAGYADGGEEIQSFYNNRGLKPIISADKTLLFYNISDLEVDRDKAYQERIKIPGFEFLQDISSFCGLQITSRECAELAEKMCSSIPAVSEYIYSWLKHYGTDDMSNEEYIILLYKKILGRMSVANEESQPWIMLLDNQSQNRSEVLNGFLSSEEFRNKYHLYNYLEYDTNSDIISFLSEDYNADKYILSGISHNENDYTWSDGKEINFQKLKLVGTNSDSYLLNLSIAGVYGDTQKIILYCNGAKVFDKEVSNTVELYIPITPDVHGLVDITILLPNATSPIEKENSMDKRELAIQLEKIQIRQFIRIDEN